MASPVAVDRSSGLWTQFHSLVGWGRLLLTVLAGLFVFLFLAEAFRVYQLAAGIHPWLGLASLAGMAVGLALIVYPAYRFLRMPTAVKPPAIPAADEIRLHHLLAELRFLDRYLANCYRNPAMAANRELVRSARADLAPMRVRFKSATPDAIGGLCDELKAWIRTRMSEVLRDVDAKADRLIYQEALTVGIATGASPNGTLDAFFMLWRSVKLVSQIAELYYGRPGIWGTLVICRDVSIATAFAGYVQNLTDSLGGIIAKSVGGVSSVVAGPAVEGVTNGIVLIRIGYLAQERCRSFREWDTQTRRSAIVSAIASTQRVAFGLSKEILRQVGSGIGVVAGAMASGAAYATGAAAEGVSSAANSAVSAVVGISESITARFRRRPSNPS